MTIEFHQPTKIAVGAGARHKAAELCKGMGSRAMIVATPSAVRCGLADELAKALRAAGIAAMVCDRVAPNPTTTDVDAAAAEAREQRCDFVIGLGGGSAMDTAKAVAVAVAHGGPVWPFAIGEKEITAATLPVVAITTTSGSGSHVTMFSVVTNPETKQKPGMVSPFILPRVAIVDPELMLTLPPAATRASGFDVFAQGVEAYTSAAASPMSDLFAEKAVEGFARHFRAVLERPDDVDARAGMALADTYAGVAINHAVVSLGHALAHPISGHYPDIAHGDALYAVYREVLCFNAAGLSEKHAWIANQLVPGCTDIVAAFDEVIATSGFENKLKAKQPDEAALEQMTDEVFTYLAFALDLNPVKVTPEAALRILSNSIK